MKQSSVSESGENTQPAGQEKPKATEFRVVDKRQFLHPDQIASKPPTEEKPRYPTFVEELLARLSENERLFEDKRQRVDEEIARMRVRLEADFERRLEIEKRNLMLPLLDVLDNLERAAEVARASGCNDSLLEGVAMTANLFRSKLKMHGVEPIPVLEQSFDPATGHAVGVVEVSEKAKDGVVMEEVLRGYRMGGQLLRPAQVRVGRMS